MKIPDDKNFPLPLNFADIILLAILFATNEEREEMIQRLENSDSDKEDKTEIPETIKFVTVCQCNKCGTVLSCGFDLAKDEIKNECRKCPICGGTAYYKTQKAGEIL